MKAKILNFYGKIRHILIHVREYEREYIIHVSKLSTVIFDESMHASHACIKTKMSDGYSKNFSVSNAVKRKSFASAHKIYQFVRI